MFAVRARAIASTCIAGTDRQVLEIDSELRRPIALSRIVLGSYSGGIERLIAIVVAKGGKGLETIQLVCGGRRSVVINFKVRVADAQ